MHTCTNYTHASMHACTNLANMYYICGRKAALTLQKSHSSEVTAPIVLASYTQYRLLSCMLL